MFNSTFACFTTFTINSNFPTTLTDFTFRKVIIKCSYTSFYWDFITSTINKSEIKLTSFTNTISFISKTVSNFFGWFSTSCTIKIRDITKRTFIIMPISTKLSIFRFITFNSNQLISLDFHDASI